MRFVLIALLAIATLGFGAAGLCGAAFTMSALVSLPQKGPENFSAGILVIAVPSLLIGGGVAWWCGRMLKRLFQRKP